MNYKKVLEKLGLIENKDFSLTVDSFTMLEQSRMIPQIVHHDLVPAILDVDGITVLVEEIPAYDEVVMITHPMVPAVYEPDVLVSPEIAAYDETTIANHPEIPASFDNEGNEISPIVPAWDETVIIHHDLVPAVYQQGMLISPEIAEWSEPVLVEELFTLPTPSLETLESTWKGVQVSEVGIATLVNEFLKGKDLLRDSEDSINIVEDNIHTWSFKNIAQPTIDELVALIPAFITQSTKDALIKEKADKGKKFREDCDRCLDLITGFNDGNNLSAVQIQQMLTTFANINGALSNRMPKTAKALLLAVVPDGVIVTQEMKDMALEVLVDYPAA